VRGPTIHGQRARTTYYLHFQVCTSKGVFAIRLSRSTHGLYVFTSFTFHPVRFGFLDRALLAFLVTSIR
jgi:hypothetical protein